jgi:hypothetical protein
MMGFVKSTFLLIVAMAFMAYAFACGASTTPEQATQCCKSMPCSPHGHGNGMECCKSMPSMLNPFLQPAPAQNVSFYPVVFAVLSMITESDATGESDRVVTANCHAPPIFAPPALLSLRI